MSALGEALRAADAAAVGRFDVPADLPESNPTPVVPSLVVEPDARAIRAPDESVTPKVTVLLSQDVR